MKVEYDTPIEVSPALYGKLMNDFGGIIAGRTENGKFYIKCWMMRYVKDLENALK